jgi:hypothetical protein
LAAIFWRSRESASVVFRQRPESNMEAWNLGLITAHRQGLTPAENKVRMGARRYDIGNRFGLFRCGDGTSGRQVVEPV